tara:strand:+ start:749 stop:1120 length:372 start_codon:yes stop_codon:yes gene_type:complete
MDPDEAETLEATILSVQHHMDYCNKRAEKGEFRKDKKFLWLFPYKGDDDIVAFRKIVMDNKWPDEWFESYLTYREKARVCHGDELLGLCEIVRLTRIGLKLSLTSYSASCLREYRVAKKNYES